MWTRLRSLHRSLQGAATCPWLISWLASEDSVALMLFCLFRYVSKTLQHHNSSARSSGKVYGESVLLGSQFTKLITYYDFKLDASLAPCFRIACVACQMSSPKQSDGIAKIIYKSDLDAAKTKRKAELQEVEHGLKEAWLWHSLLAICQSKPRSKCLAERLSGVLYWC